jgi:hypothetical protein
LGCFEESDKVGGRVLIDAESLVENLTKVFLSAKMHKGT